MGAPLTLKEALIRGIRLKCPNCGTGKLYRAFLKVHDICPACAFPLKDHDAADGPAYVAMSIMAVKVTALAIWFEFAFEPPMWLHAVLWIPLTFLGSLVLLIFAKSLFIAVQYHYKSGVFGQ